MRYGETSKKLAEYRKHIAALRQEMRALQEKSEPEEVKDYTFATAEGGTVRLSDLFGDHDTLFVVHNMGRSCPYCTLWADGFNGVFEHLNSRAAFVVSSPDPPEEQQRFAKSRGWRFPMVSHLGTSFAEDMGYYADGPLPGISVFKLKEGKILRIADRSFSPGDDFCAVWHLFDLIPEGAAGWEPKYHYAARSSG
jgi:predicted dithiol-disulfide oxidoreductase (DUF899 family)